MHITVFFYLLDALQGERKDRSVLFWKSMPVSDTTTVLSKLFTALAVSGAIVIVVAIATQLAVLLVVSVILIIGGTNPAPIWGMQLFQITAAVIYWQIAIALWYAPLAAWLLLVSAWAKRVTILWAVFTPIAIVLFERVAIGTHYRAGHHHLSPATIRCLQTIRAARTRSRAHCQQRGRQGLGNTPASARRDRSSGFFSNPWLWVGLSWPRAWSLARSGCAATASRSDADSFSRNKSDRVRVAPNGIPPLPLRGTLQDEPTGLRLEPHFAAT